MFKLCIVNHSVASVFIDCFILQTEGFIGFLDHMSACKRRAILMEHLSYTVDNGFIPQNDYFHGFAPILQGHCDSNLDCI